MTKNKNISIAGEKPQHLYIADENIKWCPD